MKDQRIDDKPPSAGAQASIDPPSGTPPGWQLWLQLHWSSVLGVALILVVLGAGIQLILQRQLLAAIPPPPIQVGVGGPSGSGLFGSGLGVDISRRLGLGEMPAEALPAASRAYRAQFGHGMDEDLPTYETQVEGWLKTWKIAYEAGEPWATGMAGP